MAKKARARFLEELGRRLGPFKRLAHRLSLLAVADGAVGVYVRYSMLHEHSSTLYGLRQADLRRLEGRTSFICFLWAGQEEPLIVPFAKYRNVFHRAEPAAGGLYKSQVFLQPEGTELCVANAGRFNVESHFGWEQLEAAVAGRQPPTAPDLDDAQVQTLLGGLGVAKGYDVWIPPDDRGRLDWSVAERYESVRALPSRYEPVADMLQKVDVVWLKRRPRQLRAVFALERSKPLYSGLLRFNDLHLALPAIRPSFVIAGSRSGKGLFVRQIQRPTFKNSGLDDLCSFLEYPDVYQWYTRTIRSA